MARSAPDHTPRSAVWEGDQPRNSRLIGPPAAPLHLLPLCWLDPLNAGIDASRIALWLGHEQERSTQVYLHADLALKQRALDRIQPASGHPGRYRAPDRVLAFLDAL
jgi:hypothetical protein